MGSPMKILVKVKTLAKLEKVEKKDDGSLLVHVNSAPIDGKANAAVLKLLSKYLKIPKSRLSIVRGLKSKNKIIEVLS